MVDCDYRYFVLFSAAVDLVGNMRSNHLLEF